MRDDPRPFEVYRHFKGNQYQILTLATDSENERPLVVYQALYGEYKVYVRPLDSFMSEVDREKYPYAEQIYRFERVNVQPAFHGAEVQAPAEKPKSVPTVNTPQEEAWKVRTQEESPQYEEKQFKPEKLSEEPAEDVSSELAGLDPAVLEYLDADSITKRLTILTGVHHRITDEMIDTMAACSDIEVEAGPLEERYQSLKNCLATKQKFEKERRFS